MKMIENSWQLQDAKTNLLKFFQNSPLSKINSDIKRNKDLPRDIEL